MDEKTIDAFNAELSDEYKPEEIENAMGNINARLLWTVDSECLVFSRSKNKWFEGNIDELVEIEDTEWMMIKYDGNKTKKMQRFCFDVKPMDPRFDHERRDNQHLMKMSKYILEKLRSEHEQQSQDQLSVASIDEKQDEDTDDEDEHDVININALCFCGETMKKYEDMNREWECCSCLRVQTVNVLYVCMAGQQCVYKEIMPGMTFFICSSCLETVHAFKGNQETLIFDKIGSIITIAS